MSSFRLSNWVLPGVLTKKKKKESGNLTKKYRSFNLLFLGITTVPVVAVGLLNYAVDPYDLFNTPNWFGINHVKPKKDNNDRMYKAADITRIKPVTIILGSSRTKQGLNPEHPALKDQQPGYNSGLNGANMYEARRYLEHVIANQKDLKEVILGIDFFMFNSNLANQPSFSESRLEKQHIDLQDAINSLFSIDTLWVSQNTINESLKQPNQDDNYGENGFMYNRSVNNNETEWRFTQGIKLYWKLHSGYEFSNEYLADFKKVVELCQENNIDLKVFISPAHAADLEAIRITGRWQTYEQWQREIVKIMPIWDFAGYNSITTEPINTIMKNYADNSHYTTEIGNLMFDRIFGYQEEAVPNDFGILITPENVEEHLAKIRGDREIWLNNHYDDYEFVQQLKQKFDAENEQKE